MGSQGDAIEELESQPFPFQGSLYSLTLDEVQTHLGNLEKPLGSMNLDELLKNLLYVGANELLGTAVGKVAPAFPRQGSFTLSTDISKKTVEDIWREIQKNKTINCNHEGEDRQPTLGEMTLEDLLLEAGVVTETIPSDDSGLEQDLAQMIQYHQLPTVPQQVFMSYPVSEMQLAISPSSQVDAISDTQPPGRKRVASGNVVEKTVERRQKRMIKNRESAARSRARKQAYTHELELKVAHLEEENERLRRQKKEVEKVVPNAPPPDPKRRLRRTSSASF